MHHSKNYDRLGVIIMKKCEKLNTSIANPPFKYLYMGILFLFVVLSIFVGIHHEPWADEANPWLYFSSMKSIASILITTSAYFIEVINPPNKAFL